MKWTRLQNNLPRIGAALFFVAIGSLGNSIIVQAAKIDWWRARSNELAAIGPPAPAKTTKPTAIMVANTTPSIERCPPVGKKGDVIVHVVR